MHPIAACCATLRNIRNGHIALRDRSLAIGRGVFRLALLVFSFVFVFSFSSAAVVQDFGSYGDPPAGTVIFGDHPYGIPADGTFFPDFIVSAVNHGNGPQSLIIFDSSHPTGDDFDLGTPNETCDPPGPGQGQGGEQGQQGENCEPLYNLLIIAENIVDANGDGRVDDPDDDAGGGEILFEFDSPFIIDYITIMDIDKVAFSSSGAIGRIEYHPETQPTPIKFNTWGTIKPSDR